MPLLLWDTSALVKRYAKELGTDTVNTLFSHIPSSRMVASVMGYVETFAALVRAKNRRDITEANFITSSSALEADLIHDDDFRLLTIDDDAFYQARSLVYPHNINTSDAALLGIYMNFAQERATAGEVCNFVAADERFIREQQAEGLHTLIREV